MSQTSTNVTIQDNGLMEEEEEKMQEEGQRMLRDALKKVDELESELKGFQPPAAAARPAHSSASSSATCSGSSIAHDPFLGVGQDVGWSPMVPRGHSPFSWGDSTATAMAAPTSAATSSAAPASASASSAPAAEEKKERKGKQQQQPKKEEKKKEEKPKKEEKKKEEKKKVEAPKMSPEEQKAFDEKEAKLSLAESFGRLDVRVGQIVEVAPVANSAALYVEKIDLGEKEPRQIVSGLRKFYKLEEMKGARVLVIMNLAPAVLCNTKSNGMVFAASNAEHTHVELITPPAEAKVGERVSLQGHDVRAVTATPNLNIREDPVWGSIAKRLLTNDQAEACFANVPFVVGASNGHCSAKTLKQAHIS